MKAEDTVMSDEQIQACVDWRQMGVLAGIAMGGRVEDEIDKALSITRYLLRQQAEISFKAGYEQVWKDGIIQQTFDEGKRAGMEEEAKGGTNALSYLRGVEEGYAKGFKDTSKLAQQGELIDFNAGYKAGIREVLEIGDNLVTGFRVDAHIFLQRLKEQALKERGQ